RSHFLEAARMTMTTTRLLRGSLQLLAVVTLGCTGKVSEPGNASAGTGGAGAGTVDPGIIDPVGGTGGGNGAGGGVGTQSCTPAFIASFGRQAYRRPLADDEKASLLALFAQGASLIDGGATAFQKGVQITLEAMLQSPNFLYRPELSVQQVGGLIVLGGYEL